MKMGGKLLGHKNCPLTATNRAKAKGTQVTYKYLVHALPIIVMLIESYSPTKFLLFRCVG